MREHPHALGWLLYRLGQLFYRVLFTLVWRLEVSGRDNVPRQGRVIFAGNHRSYADPPVVGCVAPRIINYMAKKELFDVPIFGWLIKQTNAFPVRRGVMDLSAIKRAQDILQAEGSLIMFPEGTRQKNGGFGQPRSGVGLMAIRGNAPVVPVYLHNTDRLLSFAKVRVIFGQPLHPGPEKDPEVFTRRVMDAIIQLKEDSLGSQNS